MIYIFLFLIIIAYLLNNLSKKYALYEVHYKRELSKKNLEVGEEFHITTVIENKKPLPVTFLQVIEKFPSVIKYNFEVERSSTVNVIEHKTTMMILPYQRVKRDYTVYCSERGRYFLSDVDLIAGDLLGLNTTNKQVVYNEEIVVYPKPLNLDTDIVAIGDYNGNISVKRWIIDDPLITVGVREYTGLEPEKSIHWPSSLKTGKLMVRNFDYTSENSVLIILNIECYKPFWTGIDKEYIEKCYSVVRSLADNFEASKIQYGLSTNSQIGEYFNGKNYMRPSMGRAHYSKILDCLGRADYGITVGFEDLIANILSLNINCRTYIIITPKVLPSYVEYINRLKVAGDRIVLMCIEEENVDKVNRTIGKFKI